VTLTQFLPTVRSSIPDPLTIDLWPEYTVSTTTDVMIAGVSMVELSHWCGTPCVHTAAAVIPGTHGKPSPTEICSVVVATVTEVLHGGHVRLVLDADLDRCGAIASEARLVGRLSHARGVAAWVRDGSDPAILPEDVRVGDLVAIPCRHTTRLRDVRIALDDHPAAHCGR
jgi:hypothetical protein